MAKQKPVFAQQFNTTEAMSVPFNMPGGRNFLLRLIGWGAALFLLVYAVFGRSIFGNYKEFLIASMELDQTNPDPEAAIALMEQLGDMLWPALLLSLFAWVIMAAIETAMHKNVFRGTDHGVFPLRFGKDEMRVMIAQFVLALSMMGVYILVVIAVVIMATLTAALGAITPVLAVIGGLATFAGTIFLFGLLIYFCLSVAPAAAMSVRDEKQYLYEGRKITKGRGWPLFGTYLVVAVVGYIGIYIIMLLGAYLAFGDMQAIAALSGLDVENPRELFDRMGEMLNTPKVKITLVIFTIAYFVALMVWYLCFWGVANYAAQLDAREKASA